MLIKNKILLWFLLPSILITIAMTVSCFLYIYKVVRGNIFDQLEIAADEMRNNVKIFLSGKKGRTVDFSSDGFIIDCIEKIARKDSRREYYIQALNTHLVTNKKPLDPDILAVFVVDLDGKVIGSTDVGLLNRDVSGEACISETMKRGSYITDIHYHPDYKQNIYFSEEYFINTTETGSFISNIHYPPEYIQNTFFDVSRILLRKGGQDPLGIIVNRYNGDSLSSAIRRGITEESGQEKQLNGLGETGEIYIVNKDKLMITESRFLEDAMHNQVVDTEGVREAFHNGIGMVGAYPDYRDIPVLGVSKYFEEMKWVIVASKHASEAFAPIRYLRNFAIIIGATGIIVIVLVAVFISTGVTAYLEKTSKATRRIARNDIESPIMDYKSMVEFKNLGRLINAEIHKNSELSALDIRSMRDKDSEFLKLKRSSQEWVTTFDAHIDIITIHDKDSGLVRGNKAFYEKFDVEGKQLIGKQCSQVFSCTKETYHNCLLTMCVTSLKPECGEVDDPSLGGTHQIFTYPLLDEKGLFQGAVRQQKDITERKKVDEKIKRSERFSENLIETAQDAIVCIDQEGIVRVWNRSAGNIFKYSKSEIIGKPITIIIPEKYKQKHLEGLKRFLQTGQPIIIGKSIDITGKTKEGKEVPIGLSLSFQKIENKRYFFTGIIRDRTFEVGAKRQLEAKAKELEEYSQVLEE
ncbi:MAG: PAS domain S-box protein, partial [Candidatus Scalindua sp.]